MTLNDAFAGFAVVAFMLIALAFLVKDDDVGAGMILSAIIVGIADVILWIAAHTVWVP